MFGGEVYYRAGWHFELDKTLCCIELYQHFRIYDFLVNQYSDKALPDRKFRVKRKFHVTCLKH